MEIGGQFLFSLSCCLSFFRRFLSSILRLLRSSFSFFSISFASSAFFMGDPVIMDYDLLVVFRCDDGLFAFCQGIISRDDSVSVGVDLSVMTMASPSSSADWPRLTCRLSAFTCSPCLGGMWMSAWTTILVACPFSSSMVDLRLSEAASE